MGKLNDTALRRIKATGKVQKMTDGQGLYLYVSAKGCKTWRYDYAVVDKRKTLTIGQYPEITLARARELHREARRQVSEGEDPCAHKQAVRKATEAEVTNAFENVALDWFENKQSTWSPAHIKRIKLHLRNDLVPSLGAMGINDIKAPELLNVIRKIEARGANDTAHRVLNIVSLIFRYAIATGSAERNPAADLRGALEPVRSKNFATIVDRKEIAQLLNSINNYTGHHIVKKALQIAPYVFVRPSELRCATWNEFDIHGAHEWRIPAERMKMRQAHIVPLSNQVIELLEELYEYSTSNYLFPSMRTNTAPISDMTLLNALRRMGYGKDQMTVHGFRSMASTLLNEQGYNRDWIERQLAHSERNNVRAAYNHAEYLQERRRMMQEWANFLDTLR